MVTVRLPDELRDAIDAARGDVPRERWVRRALEQALNGSVQSAPEKGSAAQGVGPEKAPRSPARVSAPAQAHDEFVLPKIGSRKRSW